MPFYECGIPVGGSDRCAAEASTSRSSRTSRDFSRAASRDLSACVFSWSSMASRCGVACAASSPCCASSSATRWIWAYSSESSLPTARAVREWATSKPRRVAGFFAQPRLLDLLLACQQSPTRVVGCLFTPCHAGLAARPAPARTAKRLRLRTRAHVRGVHGELTGLRGPAPAPPSVGHSPAGPASCPRHANRCRPSAAPACPARSGAGCAFP